VLMISNVCYFLFNFLNLQSGWIHRVDRGDWERPFRCPTWLLALATIFSFINIIFMGAGADVWGEGTLRNGLFAAALILPVFLFRHYVQDGGKFPDEGGDAENAVRERTLSKKGGALPYIALVACAALIWLTHSYAVLPQ
jgi:amino acid transporter